MRNNLSTKSPSQTTHFSREADTCGDCEEEAGEHNSRKVAIRWLTGTYVSNFMALVVLFDSYCIFDSIRATLRRPIDFCQETSESLVLPFALGGGWFLW